MSEDQAPVEKVSEETLENAVDFRVDQLSLSEKERLSLSLFPETHTKEVELLGKERILRPLTIKYSRRVNKLLEPYMERLAKTSVEGSKEAVEGVSAESVLKDLFLILDALCEFYGESWNDIKTAVSEEGLSLVEMENAIVMQSHLNTVNDFLLVPLRTLIRMMQLEEIRTVRLESLANMSIMLQLPNFGDVPSTTLSQSTPTDS